MLIIHCPFCGPRNESEYIHGGPVKKQRPHHTDQISDNEWLHHLTVPVNPVGDVQEKWWHVRGCGQWVTITRHTVTHEITQVINQDGEDTEHE